METANPTELIEQAAHHQRAGRVAEAERLLEQVVRAQPANEAAVQGLLRIWTASGHAARCAALLERAVAADPANPHFHGDLGVLQQRARHLAAAERSFREAIRLRPDDALPRMALGQLLADARRMAEAEEQFRHALRSQPGLVVAHVALATLAGVQGRLVEARRHAERAVQVAPQAPQSHHALGSALHALGMPEQAHASFARCAQLGVTSSTASSLLYNLNFIRDVAPEQVANAHRDWGRHFADHVPRRFKNTAPRDAGRRLRVGYVSPDFRAHAVSFFVEPLLQGHDRTRVEVFCYSAVQTPDATTQRLKSHADEWRDITTLADDRAAEVVHADGIDVLVDLAGHTDRHRLGIFAHRPAPVEVTYQGYPNTTGMRAIGYRLTDSHADPPGATDRHHTERLVRLPQTAWCYRPPDAAPPVSPLPALRRGQITFGSFNRLAKISSFTIELWTRAVLAVPGSRLLLKTSGLNDPQTQAFVRESFAKCGLRDPERLVLLGPEDSPEAHLARYHAIDVALDCYPYHGTTTSCEAMWMGVPSIVLAGAVHVSRVGCSLAASAGLTEFVAESPEQFVAIAARVAADLQHLAQLRQGMRRRLRASPLMDEPAFCRAVEEAYSKMLRDAP